ncbi:unnamed protein product, partial [Darwinula stevensoni]
AVVTPTREQERRKLVYCCLGAFGIPACFLALACVSSASRSGRVAEAFRDVSDVCVVLDDPRFVWWSFGLVTLLVVADVVFVALAYRFMIENAGDVFHLAQSRRRTNEYLLNLKLSGAMGGLWLAGIVCHCIGVLEGDVVLILASIPGFFAFYVFLRGDAEEDKEVTGWLARCRRGEAGSPDSGDAGCRGGSAPMPPIRGDSLVASGGG